MADDTLPNSEYSARIAEAASLRVQGTSWVTIAQRYSYANNESARKALTGNYPDAWRAAYEAARQRYLDEVESEAVLTSRELLRPEQDDGQPRDERIRLSAAQGLQAHCAKLRAQKLEISGPDKTPLKVYLADVDDE